METGDTVKNRVMYKIAAVLAAAATAAACSGGGGSSSARGGSGTTSIPAAATDPNAVLRMASITGNRTYDPVKVTTCPGEYWTLQLVYARLTDLTPDFKVVPMLADSWNFTSDGSALVLHLHPGVTFHDGTPFNAASVKVNLDRVMTSPISTIKGELASVLSVSATDDKTVQLNLKPGTGYELPEKLSGCAGMIVNPASLASPTLDQTGDGLGPYVVKPGSLHPGTASTLERAPGTWWGDPAVGPHFSEIQAQSIPDQNAMMNALQTGQLDLVNITPDQFSRADQMAQTGQFIFKKLDTQLNIGIALNLNRSLLQSVDLRQALNIGIDRVGINKALFNGGCTPSVQPAYSGGIGYDPQLEKTWAYDPAKAKQLLAKAGNPSPTIEAIQINLAPYSTVNDAVQSQLRQVGVTFNMTQPEAVAQVLGNYRKGTNDALGFPLGASLNPLGAINDFAVGPYVVNGTTTPAVKAAQAGILDPKLSDADRQAKALALNQAIVNDATMLTVCRIQKGVVASRRLIGADQSAYIQFGTMDVERMQFSAK